jgi:hypothetical protein
VSALLLTRFLRGLVYGVSAMDPITIMGVTTLLLAIGIAPCLLPSLRPTHINPVPAIRKN